MYIHVWIVIGEEVFGKKKPHNSSMLSTTKYSVLASASVLIQNYSNEPPNSKTDSASNLPNVSFESPVSCVTVRRGSFGRIGSTMTAVSKILGLGGSKKK